MERGKKGTGIINKLCIFWLAVLPRRQSTFSSVFVLSVWLCVYHWGWGELEIWLSFLGWRDVDENTLNKERAPVPGPWWYGLRRALTIVQQLTLLSR